MEFAVFFLPMRDSNDHAEKEADPKETCQSPQVLTTSTDPAAAVCEILSLADPSRILFLFDNEPGC